MTRVVKLQEAFDAKQDEMKNLQIQALDRLALLQNNVKSLLTQTYELHEYPIPRLFIVLPQDRSSWDPLDLFSHKFRLYFLCECGEHTKSNKSTIPHHIHLAKHEGYDIVRPKEFFRQYSSYVLTILRMLKFGISVAGVAVPAVSLLVCEDTIVKTSSSLRMLIGNLQSGMDETIMYLEKMSKEDQAINGPSQRMKNNEALEGADLRQLETFLMVEDENRVLGNLYKIVTPEGHVKWVCVDHYRENYRENYREKAAKAFHNTMEALRGSFDESMGRVEVKLRSRIQAEQFYAALTKAKSVYELVIDLDWETTRRDFKSLRDALAVTCVGVLELNLNDHHGPTIDVLNRGQRYDPIFDMIRHSTIRSVTIVDSPRDFVQRSSLLSRDDDFSNLQHLEIPIHLLQSDVLGFRHLIAKAPNLSCLVIGSRTLDGVESNAKDLQDVYDHLVHLYSTIAEHQTYFVIFKEQDLCIPPPPVPMSRELSRSMTIADHGERLILGIHKLKLYCHRLDPFIVDTLVKAADGGLGIKTLVLRQKGWLQKEYIDKVAIIVARSELHQIDIDLDRDEDRVRILESIQWEHLRELSVDMDDFVKATKMRALADCVKKESGRVRLEAFRLMTRHEGRIWRIVNAICLERFQERVSFVESLEAFIASTSLETNELRVNLAASRLVLLLSIADFSQLRHLSLSLCFGFNSAEVEAVLDSIQHATQLHTLRLFDAEITSEQVERMKAKGITLSTCQ